MYNWGTFIQQIYFCSFNLRNFMVKGNTVSVVPRKKWTIMI